MIRRAICALLLATPVQAQSELPPVMTAEQCALGWLGFASVTDQSQDIRNASADVTADGWCRVDKSNTVLTSKDFETMEWRARGVVEAIANQGAPLSLELRSTGIDPVDGFGLVPPEGMDLPLVSLSMHLSRSPQDRTFSIHNVTTDFGALGQLTFQMQGGGIDLTSLKTMQIGLGGMRVYSAQITLQTAGSMGGDLAPALAPFAFTEEARTIIDALPVGAIDDNSRAALATFAKTGGAIPGSLTLTAQSDAGLGVLQITGALIQIDQGNQSDPDYAAGLEILLDGVTLTASWMPEI